jgi:hypothetical protein
MVGEVVGREAVTLMRQSVWPRLRVSAAQIRVLVMTEINSQEPVEQAEQAPASDEVEGELREIVRQDLTNLRRNPETDSDLAANNIGSLLQRVASSSVQEIDRQIAELESLREMLSIEGARVQQAIVQYATLSQSAIQSTRIIAESLSHWKRVPDAPSIQG